MYTMLRAMASGSMLICVAAAVDGRSQEISMSRANVIKSVKKGVVVRLIGPDANADRTKCLDGVSSVVDELAPVVLPDIITGPSQQVIDVAASNSLQISYTDEAYIQAAVKLHLMGIPLAVKYLAEFPPASPDEISQVRASIEKARAALVSKMDTELVPMNVPGLTHDEIDSMSREVFGGLSGRVGNPLSYSFIIPLSDSDIKSLADDFDKRLQDNRDLIKQKIEAGMKKFGVEHKQAATVDGVLERLLVGTLRFIYLHTSDMHREALLEAAMDTQEWRAAQKDYDQALQRCMAAKPPPPTARTTMPAD